MTVNIPKIVLNARLFNTCRAKYIFLFKNQEI